MSCLFALKSLQGAWRHLRIAGRREDAGVLLLISRAVSEACKRAVTEKLEGARELSEKEAVEAVCQVFTNTLEYEPTTPVASACAGSAAQQGAAPPVPAPYPCTGLAAQKSPRGVADSPQYTGHACLQGVLRSPQGTAV